MTEQQAPTELDQDRYDEFAGWIESRFAGYVKTRKDGGPLAQALDYDTHLFGGKFEALTVEEFEYAEEGGSDRGDMPGQVFVAVRVYSVAMTIRPRNTPDGAFDVKTDANAEAKRRCRRIHGLWRAEFLKDRRLRSRAQARIVSAASGTADDLGNYHIDETGTNILRVHRTIVAATPA